MDVQGYQRDRKRWEWMQRILDCRSSGLPVRIWCEQNQISASSYYYWLKVVRQDMLVLEDESSFAGSSSLVEPPVASTPVIFHELPLLPEPAPAHESHIALELPGLTLTVSPEVTAKQVRAAMAVLRSLCF